MLRMLVNSVGVIALLGAGCGGSPESARPAETARPGGTGGSSLGGGDFGNSDNPTRQVLGTTGGPGFVPNTSCKAGYYLGQVNGFYESSAAFGFTPGGIPITTDPKFITTEILNTLFPPLDGVSPGFEFWLTPSEDAADCGVGEEFCFDYKVEGGKARGVANGLFPFEFDMNGQLDCSQGHFEGIIENGQYTVAGIPFFFEGTLQASYDDTRGAFVAGTWEVVESGGLPNSGGRGDWYADLTPEP